MKLATVVGPLRDLDAVVLDCIVGQEFHPESAVSFMKQVSGLYPLDPINPYQNKLRRAEHLLGLLNLEAPKGAGAVPALSEESAGETLSRLETRVESLLAEREERVKRLAEDEQLFSQLKLLRDIDVPIEGLYQVTYTKFRFGRLPRDNYDHFFPIVNDLPDVFFFPTDVQKEYVYGMYLMPRSGFQKVDTLLASLQFERIRLSEKLHGSSAEAEQTARADQAENKVRVGEIQKELAEIGAGEADTLREIFRFYRFLSGAFEIKRYAARSEESFYLTGWVPEPGFARFEQSFARWKDVSFFPVEDEESNFTPPTKLANSPLFRPFEPFVTMYGLPAYDEIDPTPLVALTYPLIFGVMFGDLGHAALLLLAGLLMWRRKGMWMGRVLCYCAAGSAMFGLLYGSVFGDEELLPWGFKVLHSGETIFYILRVTVYAGAALVALSILLNILNGIRQRDWEKIVFGPASLTGLVLYAGVVFAVLPFIGFGASPFPSPVLAGMIVLPALVIFFKGSPGLTGFFELFDVFLSFITNTISFLRVGAYAIAHASLMAVVYNIAGGPDGPRSILALIVGNLLVAGLEAVLVAIQVLRLEYYEIFGRFFSGGGKAYRSLNAEE